MDKKTVVITEKDGNYDIRNDGISEFALLGILECIVFDMKTAGRKAPPEPENSSVEQKETFREQKKDVQEPDKKVVRKSNVADVRTRIGNAVKAIKSLGGEVKDLDRSDSTEEELQAELEELTNQYKRLKSPPEASKQR